MQAAFQRTLSSGREYEKYFPTSQLQRTDPIMVKAGDTFDTIELMAKLARQYQADTAGVAPLLLGKNREQTCRNVFSFAHRHFQYTPDKDGVEQLRRPLRSWADRRAGIDCDCYSILVSTILLNLGVAHKLRKTKYNNRPDYQHIYVVVPAGTSYFTIDPVTDAFNKEVPFTEKFDKSMMPIQVLNGLGDAPSPAKTPLVAAGSYQKFGFGAEFVGLTGETEQVRQQTLSTIRTLTLQGLAGAVSSDVLPTANQVAELANATGQTHEEATADAVAVAHLSASFIERLRQLLVNTAEQIDRLPASQRNPELVRLRGRLRQLLAAWSNEAERTRLFDELGEQEERELTPAGVAGLGNIFSDAWDGIKNAASSVTGAVSQAASWTYGTVIKPVGQAIGQAASWVGNTVATGAKAAAAGIKQAAVWVGKEAVNLGKLLLKYNPLSILIRAGLRIAFRVNLFHLSGRLGHGYFSQAQAVAAGLDAGEWEKAKSQLGKVISMWEGLQGEADILQESILIGYQSGEQPKIAAQPALSGLGRLGEPVTAASTVAASGFIATILSWLKNVDWGKLMNVATTVAQKLKLTKAYDSVPAVNENTLLPASEAAYTANKTLYDTQPSSSSLVVPLVLGGAVLGFAYLNNANGSKS